MAKTVEQVIEAHLGAQVLRIANLQTQLELALEQIKRLEEELDAAKKAG